ncbi:MAG: EVE domain-containing protein [Blastocatellia bacterium]|nr:EVE domain-containing protein [Blastocatellia bacterium]
MPAKKSKTPINSVNVITLPPETQSSVLSPQSCSQQFWLLKSEPTSFSIEDLRNAPNQTTCWDGVRNYQARNYLRDVMQVGDGVLFYHSNAEPAGIAGLAEVVRTGYPDDTAFDADHHHYDPKSNPANPTWFMVDIKLVRVFRELIPLPLLKQTAGLENMQVVQRGSRLSVQPVTAEEWKIILKLGGK